MTVLEGLKFVGGAVLLAFAGGAAYFCCSPMPIVRLLRRGKDAQASWPAGEEDAENRVETICDLTYESSYGRNCYDLYLPKDGGEAMPVLLWVHGGAFVAGNKEGVKNWASCLAAKGIAVAAVEYQWAPEASWPAQVIQIGQCCRALKAVAEEKKLDLSRVVIAGDSAGAHMAAQFALIHSSEAFRRDSGLEPSLEEGALKAALLFCGPYDIGAMARPSSRFLRLAMHRVGWSYLGKRNWTSSREAKLTVIKNYVTEAFPPTYITDGNRYSFENQGRALAAALRQKGVPVKSLFFSSEKNVNHEYQFDLKDPEARMCYDGVCEFLQKQELIRKG